jgi:hypothetical protein
MIPSDRITEFTRNATLASGKDADIDWGIQAVNLLVLAEELQQGSRRAFKRRV